MGFIFLKLQQYCVIQLYNVLLQNNLKDLDSSYMMDLDLYDCFGREKKEKPYLITE